MVAAAAHYILFLCRMWDGTERMARLCKVTNAGAAEQWGLSSCCCHEEASDFPPHEDKLKGLPYGV